MALTPLYTASQIVSLKVASTRAVVGALVDAGDLHPHGSSHARYPAHEVARLAGLPRLDVNEPAVLIRLGLWTEEDGSVFAGRRGRGYRAGLTLTELADSSRGIWRVTPARLFRAGLLIPVRLGITRGAFRIVGSGPIPVEDRWAVEVEPLQGGTRKAQRLFEDIVDHRVSSTGRNPVQFINGA